MGNVFKQRTYQCKCGALTKEYVWDNELEKMWDKIENIKPKEFKKTEVKIEYKVKGSKDNVYKVVNDEGFWSCSCPAHGFSRGKDCKHIKEIKNGKSI